MKKLLLAAVLACVMGCTPKAMIKNPEFIAYTTKDSGRPTIHFLASGNLERDISKAYSLFCSHGECDTLQIPEKDFRNAYLKIRIDNSGEPKKGTDCYFFVK
jgi:hypothetical protein